jgi:hypothetical protein
MRRAPGAAAVGEAPMKAPAPLFRWDGPYWGFVADGSLFDRYGRHVGWLEGADVYHRTGRFMGALRDGQYIVRDLLRAEPIPRAPRPAVPYPAPPAPLPPRGARAPIADLVDALPWPLPPPEPPRV